MIMIKKKMKERFLFTTFNSTSLPAVRMNDNTKWPTLFPRLNIFSSRGTIEGNRKSGITITTSPSPKRFRRVSTLLKKREEKNITASKHKTLGYFHKSFRGTVRINCKP